MQVEQTLFYSNLPGIAWSVAVSLLYGASTLALGTWLVPRSRPGWEGLYIAVRYCLGAAVFGLLFAVLAMLKLAYMPVVLLLALLPAGTALLRWRPRFRPLRMPSPAQLMRIDAYAAHIAAIFGIACLAQYPLAWALAWPRGGDMAIYHLVIPRTVLWNHGLVFNPFSYDAGLFYGWQLYALPAYLAGGDLAFQFCSSVAFAVLLFSIYRVLQTRYGALTGLVGALVVAAVICGMIRESVVNNDIPLVLLELGLLGVATVLEPRRAAAWTLGLLGGFVVAVKLVAAATAALAYAVFLWRDGPPRWQRAAVLSIATLLSLGPWLAFNYFSSGSPLLHFLFIWPPDTGYLPQFRESISYLMEHFGIWYQKNFFRLYSQGLEFIPVLLLGLAAMVFVPGARRDRFCLLLAAYALLRMLFLLAMNRFDMVLVYHDRYNLTSYVLLALAGMLGWVHLLRPLLGNWPRARSLALAAVILFAVLHVYETPGWAVQLRGGSLPDQRIWQLSLERSLHAALKRMDEAPGGGGSGVGNDVAAALLPANAVVATTVIDPYLLQRPFLQMLPVSENVIDLSLPPEELRKAMLAHGATHLHLSQHTGLNPWMEPLLDRWLESLRRVPDLPGVKRLMFLNYRTGKGTQGFYDLAAAGRPPERKWRQLREMRLTREHDRTWMIRWRPEPGGDAGFTLRMPDGKTDVLGEAASEVGWFPVRLELPERFVLEVAVLAGGRTVQTVELQPPPSLPAGN